MLAEFSIVPLGAGNSISSHVARILKIVDASGMPYKINPMGTVVEGSWSDIMKLIKKCHDAILNTESRIITTISIDDRKGKSNRIDKKVESVEHKLGKLLKK
ncbi:MAG: MTH1187 family thiamine-binding protein [Thermodesulfovibrionia bacterium]|nr:MTH1187 family thiamine-binding protein [Thermodesulfovibrionia bacterium]MCK5427143.1 MTH1187 family thiamine-binding protein [Thermodesulfovibrionia bacterium]MCK5512298.1 MTH1187 family thiamine-binding protein [Thermodesulfovibrionia bacterium]